MVRAVLKSIKPLLIAAFTYNNIDLAIEFGEKLEKEQQFLVLDIEELVKEELDR
jgi:hypothetical protein